MCERNTDCLSLAHHQRGTDQPATQARALTRNRTCNLSLCGTLSTTDPCQSGLIQFLMEPIQCFLFTFTHFIYFFQREGKGRTKRRRETSMCDCFQHAPYWGPNLAHNTSMCPDWELNQLPFGSQAGTQSTEPHQPGPIQCFNGERVFSQLLTRCRQTMCRPERLDLISHYEQPHILFTPFGYDQHGEIHCIPDSATYQVTLQE